MLDVNGTGRFQTSLSISSTTNSSLVAATNSTTGYAFVDLINNGASGKNYQIGIGGNGAASGYANNLYFDLVGVGNVMTLTSGRNVGIGTSSPDTWATKLVIYNNQLTVTGGGYDGTFADSIFFGGNSEGTNYRNKISNSLSSNAANQKMKFSVASGATTWVDALTLTGTGAATFSSTCTATGFFESSDSRLKTLIQDNYQTKGIASITPKLYTKNGKVELGYYAQDFVGILDSAVSKGSDDMLSLSYREVLVAKVYALEQEIKELKGRKFNISTTKLK
jgi:hypothetical protein